MSDLKKIKEACEILKPLLSKVKTAERKASDQRLFEKFQPIFKHENLSQLSEDQFKSFLNFSENGHWTGIHRQNSRIVKNMPRLRDKLKILLDESKEIAARIDEFRPDDRGGSILGLGSSIYTAILFTVHPDKYPVLNTKTEKTLKGLNLWDVKNSDSWGEKYKKVLNVSQALSKELNCSLVELDGLYHYYLVEVGVKTAPDFKRIFKISPGSSGKEFATMKAANAASIGWTNSGDLNRYTDLVKAAKLAIGAGDGKDSSYIASQYSYIRDEMQEGSLVLYYGKQKIIGAAVVCGEYDFIPKQHYGHSRPVSFLAPFKEVDISISKELTDFFYDNVTIKEVEDEELAETIIELVLEANPNLGELTKWKKSETAQSKKSLDGFAGFTKDSFALLKKFKDAPVRETLKNSQKEYETYLKAPLRALMQQSKFFPELILGDKIETESNVFSQINKNDYGKGGIHHHYWAAFYPTGMKRTTSPQLFTIVYPERFRFGFGFGQYSSEVQNQFANAIEESQFIDSEYIELLSELGVKFRVYNQKEDKNTYEGPIDYQKLSECLRGKDLAANFDVCLTKEEVIELGSSLAKKVEDVLKAVTPLFILASYQNPKAFLESWHNSFYEVEGEDNAIAVENHAKYTWDQLLSDMHWDESMLEVKKLNLVLENKVDGEMVGAKQFVFFGPPGTGKTLAATKISELLATSKKSHIKLVQFHQSYGYEQFIEGFKPVATNGQLSYRIEDGVFVEFCKQAAMKPKEQFVFIIDELNRGNLSKIFGELLYLLEYRDQRLNLLYSKDPFAIPSNVVVIGTMNSADRSIALVDYAIRRRFKFIEMEPKASIIASAYPKNSELAVCVKFFELLNQKIRDPKLAVGHSYFLNQSVMNKEIVENIWLSSLEPLVREYFAAAPSRLEDFDFKKLWKESEQAVLGFEKAA